MQQYPEYKSLNLPNIAESVLNRWQEQRIFERSIEEREGCPSFTFYEGPPIRKWSSRNSPRDVAFD
jgi:isoleucyl-tRNA synthetase